MEPVLMKEEPRVQTSEQSWNQLRFAVCEIFPLKSPVKTSKSWTLSFFYDFFPKQAMMRSSPNPQSPFKLKVNELSPVHGRVLKHQQISRLCGYF